MHRDRDISIFNMAFYREENVIVGVLIDFDLATYPEEVALLFIGSTGLSPSTTVTPDGSTDTKPAPMKTGQDQTATFSGGQILKNGQDRSGTTPFMAIETLDVGDPTYRHHLCHELESLFYGAVWHGVGYRYKRRIFPRPPAPEGDKKKDDHLRAWRVGTWRETMNAKKLFLDEPEPVISLISNELLGTIFQCLAGLFVKRRDAARTDRNRLKELAVDMKLQAIRLRKQGVTPGPVIPEIPPLRYENAIYPRFAELWGLKVVKCEIGLLCQWDGKSQCSVRKVVDFE